MISDQDWLRATSKVITELLYDVHLGRPYAKMILGLVIILAVAVLWICYFVVSSITDFLNLFTNMFS